jgi:hypothetical protein
MTVITAAVIPATVIAAIPVRPSIVTADNDGRRRIDHGRLVNHRRRRRRYIYGSGINRIRRHPDADAD